MYSTKTINSEAILSPKFSENDIEILKHYFEINKRYNEKINKELSRALSEHHLWGPLLKMQTPEQQKAQNERSLELQRAAIYEGKWEEYTQDLISQGITYARMNVSYSDWYDIIKMYKNYILPYIKKDFAHSVEEAVAFIDGLNKFIDYAMFAIAEAYFKEKNNIIRANEERFRAIFENSADHIFLLDKEARIQMVNHISIDFKPEDVIGKSIYDFQPAESLENVKKAIGGVFENRKPSRYETSRIDKGNKFYYASSVSPILDSDGTVNAAIIISRDVTRQKKAEEEIRELNLHLEKKVIERTEELYNINKELESFSYSISHDLRSPLRAISGFAQILVEDYSDTLSNEAKDSMSEIIHNANRMGQLIDDLLEFSRLGKQEVIKGSLNMNEMVASVIDELMSYEKKDRKIKFNVANLGNARGDRTMLKQAMMNIISNALKYTAKKEKSVIEIGFYKEDGNNVYYVKDNGAGFEMAFYKKLFGVFQRLHSSTEFGGTGVGLAIVQRVITKHGGKVWAEGKVGEGATFYVELPG
jgi:PAS domain S-box-containing protein